MADVEKPAAAGKPQPYPKTWAKMSKDEKAAWHKKYRPNRDSGKPVPPAAQPQARPSAPLPQARAQVEAERPEYQSAERGNEAEAEAEADVQQLIGLIAAEDSAEAMRGLVADLLNAVADQLRAGPDADAPDAPDDF